MLPIGHRCAWTEAARLAELRPGPLWHSIQGPSPQRGCDGYSSCSSNSLPGPASNSVPELRSVIDVSVPPRSGSARTANRSLLISLPSAWPPAGTP